VAPGSVWTGTENFPHEELKSMTTFCEKIGLEVKEKKTYVKTNLAFESK
jgi:hypothetical protein